MVDSTCVKCGTAEFEAREASPSGTERTLLSSSIRAAVALLARLRQTDLGTMIRQQNRALKFAGVQFGMQLGLDTE